MKNPIIPHRFCTLDSLLKTLCCVLAIIAGNISALGQSTPPNGAVVAGGYHYLAISSSGGVVAWGMNGNGQLGNGTTANSSVPVAVTGLTNVASVAGGYYHSVALKTDGTVWTWGYNSNGQLGDGTTTQRTSPVQVTALSGKTIVAIAAGAYHSVALDSTGTVWTWGLNSSGQLGNGTTSDSHTPVQVTSLATAISAIGAGQYHTLAVQSAGTATVYAWGLNTNGQLGNGTTTSSDTPVVISTLSGVAITAVAGGGVHSLALQSNGTVWAWGYNNDGQLGDGTTTQRTSPVSLTAITGVGGIAAGAYHSVAYKGGAAYAWGYGPTGALGNGTGANSSTAVTVSGASNVIGVAASCYGSIALESGGGVATWGTNSGSEAGDGLNQNQSSPNQVGLAVGVVQQPGTGISPISAGGYHTLVLKTGGGVGSWGYNNSSQLGDGTGISRMTPVSVGSLSGTVIGVVGGGYHSFVVRSDGSVMGWGGDGYGELGDGSNNNKVTPEVIAGLAGIKMMAAGVYSTVALSATGTVTTFGENNLGQLGNGTTTNSNVPVTVGGLLSGNTVGCVASGQYHVLAVKSDGSAVWSWGYNNDGQLGNGSTSNSTVPVAVSGLSSVSVTPGSLAGGGYHSLAVKSGGTVWAWGYNSSGQLGDGTTTQRTTPVQVTGLTGVSIIAVAAGQNHSVALDNNGNVWVWGNNANGQLGDGTFTNRSIPEKVPNLSGVTAISAGYNYTAALKSDGTVVAWGNTPDGELGSNIGGQRLSGAPTYGLNLTGSAPTVSISSPANNSTGAIGTAITLTSNASDSLGMISRVDYYLDGVLEGSATSAPYSYSYTPTTWGTFNFTAVATDNFGLTSARSSIVTVDVPQITGNMVFQSATIRPDGRVLRLVFESVGEPADYGAPDRELSNFNFATGMPVLPTLSNGAVLEYLGSFAMQGELPPVDIPNDWSRTQGGSLPLGNYYLTAVVKNSSGAIVGRTQQAQITIKAGETSSGGAGTGSQIPVIYCAGGNCYPYGYTTEIYLSTANGASSTQTLYKRFTFQSTNAGGGSTPAGQTFNAAGGIPLDVNTWLNSSQYVPAYNGVTWTADYLITSDSSVVTIGTAGLTVSAPVALLADVPGNKSTVVSNAPVTNNSLVNSSGFTDSSLTASATDYRYIASAANGGSTSNPGTEAQPFLTWDQAISYLNAHYNSSSANVVIRIRRGDTITCTSPAGISTSGTSRTTPVAFESFWDPAWGTDPGVRPIIDASAPTAQGPFSPVQVSYLLIRGLQFNGNCYTASSPSAKGFSTTAAVRGVTIDDCIFQNFTYGCSIENSTNSNHATAGLGDYARDVTLLRSQFRDNDGQGIYMHVAEDVMISQCILDRNGYSDSGFSKGTIFNHDLYYTFESYPASLWGCYVARASNDGTQLRSGGLSAYTVYDANAIDGFVDWIGGGFYKCLSQESHDIVATTGSVTLEGNGLELLEGDEGYSQHSAIDTIGEEMDSCLFINKLSGTGNHSPQALEYASPAIGNTRYSSVRHNIVYNSGAGLFYTTEKSALFPNPAGKLDVYQNQFDCATNYSYSSNVLISSWSWLSADNNGFVGTDTARINSGSTINVLPATTSGTWGYITGTEAHSSMVSPSYLGNTGTNLYSYAVAEGIPSISNENDFRNYLRNRPWSTWNSTYEMAPIYNYFSTEFPNAAP